MREELWALTPAQESVPLGPSHSKPNTTPQFQLKELPDKILPPKICPGQETQIWVSLQTTVSGRPHSFPSSPVGAVTVASIDPYPALKNLLKCHLFWEVLPAFQHPPFCSHSPELKLLSIISSPSIFYRSASSTRL